MNHLAYQELAREVLWLLLERDDLRPAVHDRIVAFQIYHLPPALDLEVPDEDRFSGLLNPLTRPLHAARLEAAILHIASHQERDSWVVSSDRILIKPSLAVGHAHLEVKPVYDPDPRRAELVDGELVELPETVADEALVRVELDARRDGAVALRRGDGLVAVSRGRTRPRVTLIGPDPGADAGQDVATLYATAAMRVADADGKTRTVPACTPVPVTHDLEFEIKRHRWKFWQRGLSGAVQILGVARSTRPGVRLTTRDGNIAVWERNKKSRFCVGRDGDDDIASADPCTSLEMHADSGDRIDVTNRSEQDTAHVIWQDGRPLAIAPRATVPLLGAHLRGLGADGDVRAVIDGQTMTQSPSTVVLRGTFDDSPDALRLIEDSEPIPEAMFGFEAPIASIYCDGQLLDSHPGEDERVVTVQMDTDELVGALLQLAVDGLGGVKIMPLNEIVHVRPSSTGQPVAARTWCYVDDIAEVQMPRCALRIEAIGRPRITFGKPVHVRNLNADPNAQWRVDGWRISVTDESLVISGRGRGVMRIDQTDVTAETTLPARAEHRLEVGGALYRIVRHNPARETLGTPLASPRRNKAPSERPGTHPHTPSSRVQPNWESSL